MQDKVSNFNVLLKEQQKFVTKAYEMAIKNASETQKLSKTKVD